MLTGVTAAMDVRDEETFGPVVSLYAVGSDDEATRLANDTDYGLNAAVYTRDIPRGRRIAAAIQAGTVNINDGYAAAWGHGRADGRHEGLRPRPQARDRGITKYTESQTVAAQRLLPIAPFAGMGEEAFTGLFTRALRVLKAAGRA